ncbi:siderophore-interacting protein, partial [Kocuria oceani]
MTTTPGSAPARPRKPQLNLTVRRCEQLSPSMVRVVLGVDEPERFQDIAPPEKYVKLVFLGPAAEHAATGHPVPGRPAPGPNPDYWALKESLPPEHQPVTRHLTIRRWIPERAELWMDFVLHGDEGWAGPWAARAEPGDRII